MFYIFWNVYQCHRWVGVVGVIVLSFHVSSSLVNIDYVNVVLKTRNFIVQWAAKIQCIIGVRFSFHCSFAKEVENWLQFVYDNCTIFTSNDQLHAISITVPSTLCNIIIVCWISSFPSLASLIVITILQWFHLPSCHLVFIQFYFLNRFEKQRDWIEQFLWLNGRRTVDGVCISKVQGTFCYVMSSRNEERFLLRFYLQSLVSINQQIRVHSVHWLHGTWWW